MKRRDISTEYVTLPAWTYANATPSRYTLAAALVLAGYEGRYVRLRAEQLRLVYDNPKRIGKKKVGIFGGELITSRKVCFGLDYETDTL